MVGNGMNLNVGNLSETFEWCKTCWLRDTDKPISNHGGDCCLCKYKRKFGKECPYWIRAKEG